MPYQWKIVIVAIAGTFMMMIDATIVNIALPHILAVFNDTIDKEQFITSAYLMAMAVSAPLATYLMSKFGVKRIYVGSLVLFPGPFPGRLDALWNCLEYQLFNHLPHSSGLQQRYSDAVGYDVDLYQCSSGRARDSNGYFRYSHGAGSCHRCDSGWLSGRVFRLALVLLC